MWNIAVIGTWLFFAALAVCLFFMVRNQIVFEHRSKAIRLVSDRVKELDQDWRKAWDIYHAYPEYDSMLFQVHKWTFAQFFPGLREKLEAL